MHKKVLTFALAALLGATAWGFADINAAAAHHNCRAGHYGYMDTQNTADTVLKDISLRFDVSSDVLERYFLQGWSTDDLQTGALLSYATGKSIDEVLSIRQEMDEPWSRVENKIGLTAEEKTEAIQKSNARYIEIKLKTDDDDALHLFKQGYTNEDVLYAAALSKYCGKSAEELMSLHRELQDWNQVARKAGIKAFELQQIKSSIKNIRLL